MKSSVDGPADGPAIGIPMVGAPAIGSGANPGSGSSGPQPDAGPAGPSASRPAGPPGSSAPSAPTGTPQASPPPRLRPPPLPGPPPGMRMPGPPLPGGFRYIPPPAPRRLLDGAQRGRLLGVAVALILVGAAFGYLVSLAVPTRYGAITTIMYNVAGQNTGDFLKTDREMATQAVLVTGRNALKPVADQSGIDVDDLTRNTSATILGQSNIIQIEVKDQTPSGAVNLANAIAKQYITVSNASGPKGYVQNLLTAVQQQLASPPTTGNTPTNTAALQAREAALQSQLDQMNLTSNQSTVLVPA